MAIPSLKAEPLATRISYYHLLAFMGSLPFDLFYSHLILGSFVVHTLIHLKRHDIQSLLTLRNLALLSVFMVTLLSSLYTVNRPGAFDQLGRHAIIVIFPLLFCLNPLQLARYRERLLLGFALVCTATVVYLYLEALRTILHYHLPLADIATASFTNHNFADPIGMHATFLSLQLAIALVYLVSIVLRGPWSRYQLLCSICAVLLLGGLVQLSSKSVFVALFIILNVAVPMFLLQGRRRVRYFALAGSVSLLLIAAVLTLGIFKTRYLTDLKYDLTLTTHTQAFDSRLDRWRTAADLIKAAPIVGHGAGTELGLLHDAFFERHYYNSFLNDLNAHSQYLSFLIKSGMVGLLVYLATLWYGFRQALRRRDLLLFAFVVLIALVSVSENLLDVDKGIIFYAFFFSFLMYSGGNDQSSVGSDQLAITNG